MNTNPKLEDFAHTFGLKLFKLDGHEFKIGSEFPKFFVENDNGPGRIEIENAVFVVSKSEKSIKIPVTRKLRTKMGATVNYKTVGSSPESLYNNTVRSKNFGPAPKYGHF